MGSVPAAQAGNAAPAAARTRAAASLRIKWGFGMARIVNASSGGAVARAMKGRTRRANRQRLRPMAVQRSCFNSPLSISLIRSSAPPTGWPTLPMVFVRGSLVGGADDLIKLIDSGELKQLL